MTIEYLKKAEKTAATGEDDTRNIVADMLKAIESGGEATAVEYNEKLDNYTGNVVVTPEQIEAASARVPRKVKMIFSLPMSGYGDLPKNSGKH